MPEFFNVQPIESALATLFDHWTPQPQSETISTQHALGRILAETITSPIALPEFRRSTVDGYAVRATDTYGATQSLPAYLKCVGEIHMGQPASIDTQQGETVSIHTGGMLPDTADAVVMVERTQQFSADEIEILAPVAVGENVIQIGEDVGIGDVILKKGQQLRPQDIGGLLAVGVTEIPVTLPPKVGILSSGDELVTPDEIPQAGQIRDINAYTLASLIQQAGAAPHIIGIARDTLEDYLTHARNGFAQVDMLVLTAGSSVSIRDLTRDVIDSLGTPGVLQHGLAVKPGKPTLLAVCDNKPVIGLPGNPVSALLVARQIIISLIHHHFGITSRSPFTQSATLTANIPSTTGRDDTIPVTLHQDGNSLMATPVFGKSNLIFNLIHADGLIHIPLNSNGLKVGTNVKVFSFTTI